jgi:hypothetical protein
MRLNPEKSPISSVTLYPFYVCTSQLPSYQFFTKIPYTVRKSCTCPTVKVHMYVYQVCTLHIWYLNCSSRQAIVQILKNWMRLNPEKSPISSVTLYPFYVCTSQLPSYQFYASRQTSHVFEPTPLSLNC